MTLDDDDEQLVLDNSNLHLISKITVLLVVRVVVAVVVTCPFIATTTHDALPVSRYSLQQIIIIVRFKLSKQST